MILYRLLAAFPVLVSVSARCYNPSPAYPVPMLKKNDRDFVSLSKALDDVFKRPENLPLLPKDIDISNNSFSVELSSQHETLWEWHYTAKPSALNENSTQAVNGDTAYRIASISKLFTTLVVLQLSFEDKLGLEDPITKYVKELPDKPVYDEFETEWRYITLRSLASQLSGILRDSIMSTPVWDILKELDHPVGDGFPLVDHKDIPSCGSFDHPIPCTKQEFLNDIIAGRPNFSPNYRSTYSNVAFVLLGYVIESVTGSSYESILQASILDRLGMTKTSLQKPPDYSGVISSNASSWGDDVGQLNSTAGIYSTTHDLSVFMRHILSNPPLRRMWLHPASFCSGTSTTYGMPWEIFHSPAFVPSERSVSFYTKSGALEGYYSRTLLVPEQGVALTIMVAGKRKLAPWLMEQLTARIVPGVEKIALARLKHVYEGRFKAVQGTLNSSLELGVDIDGPGLLVKKWISNGTDFIEKYASLVVDRKKGEKWRLQLIPTGQYRDNARKQEIWRSIFTPEVTDHDTIPNAKWDDFCAEDVENMVYAGRAVNEFIFYFSDEDMKSKRTLKGLELPGLRVSMEKEQDGMFDGLKRFFGGFFEQGGQVPMFQEL